MTVYKIKIKIEKRQIKRLKKYLRENLGAPFIIAFMALLLLSAAYFLLGVNEMADSLATVAYFMLVGGVLLQLASYMWGSQRGGKDN
ncbi:MAG: hypothetical protein QXT26_07710 [Thermoproteota archaeon]